MCCLPLHVDNLFFCRQIYSKLVSALNTQHVLLYLKSSGFLYLKSTKKIGLYGLFDMQRRVSRGRCVFVDIQCRPIPLMPFFFCMHECFIQLAWHTCLSIFLSKIRCFILLTYMLALSTNGAPKDLYNKVLHVVPNTKSYRYSVRQGIHVSRVLQRTLCNGALKHLKL